MACSAITQACSLCGGNFKLTPTFRQEAASRSARVILHGTVSNPRLKGDGFTGETDFEVKTILRANEALKNKKNLTLPRYLPVENAEKPPHYLLFCDEDKKGLDPYRGVPVRGPRTIDYLTKALKLDPKDAVGNLAFFFDYLEDPDPEVARDAFLEFAKANDADVSAVAPKLQAAKLRQWLQNEKTPPARLGIYAMLLGACGESADAALLLSLLNSKEDRYKDAADGIMAGYLRLEPKKGWAMLQDILRDGTQPLTLRFKALGTMRFEFNAHPKESRDEISKVMKTILTQGELADIAIEEMRTWKIWDHTDAIIKLYDMKGFDAPIVQRAILRYALSCPQTPASKDFLTQRRKKDPELVEEVEEGLRLERAG
jgi:hypothetical protein